jgi:hypothetical protein
MSTSTPHGDGERDAVVARALGAVATPDHAPGFWERLEDEMRRREPEADLVVVPPVAGVSVFTDDKVTEAPVHDVVLEVAPASERGARRWGRRGARALLAAAAVAVVAVAGVLVAQRDDTGPDLSDETLPTASVPGTDESTQPPTSGAPTSTPQDETGPAEQVVLDFVDALGRGDIDAAAALIGPRSEAYLTAQSGSVDAFLQVATEGFGAWSASTDRTVTLVPDMGGASVVVLEGTVQQEGTTNHRIDAFPVVHAESADAWFVDMWAFDPAVEDQRLEVVAPPAADDGTVVLAPGDVLQIAVATPGTVYFSLDGAAPEGVPTSGPSQPVASWQVPDDAHDGARVVVAYQSDSGSTYTAQAFAVNGD